MYKKIISGVLALSLVFGNCVALADNNITTGISASALGGADETNYDFIRAGLKYKIIDSNQVSIVGYDKNAFTDDWAKNDGIARISSICADNNDHRLDVTSIGDSAFYGCNMKGVEFISPDADFGWGWNHNYSITIGPYAFSNCSNLVSMIFPDDLKNSLASLGTGFITGTKIETFNIPKNVNMEGKDPFFQATNLKSITVDADNKQYTSKDGVLYDKDMVTLIKYPEGKQGTYTVPDNVVRLARDSIYTNCQGRIIIPNTVKSFEENSILGTDSNDYKIVCHKDSPVDKYLTSKDTKPSIEYTHFYSDAWTVDKQPTCTEEGSKSHHCTVCGEKSDVTKIPKVAHKYSTDWVIDKEPTCTEEGVKSHHCTNSNCTAKSNITKIPVTKHDYGEWKVTKEPTCTVKGEKQRVCSICGGVEKQEISIVNHTYGEWEVTTKPTCTEDGEATRKCSCGKTETKIISKTGHNFVKVSSTGDATFKCSNCGTVIKASSTTNTSGIVAPESSTEGNITASSTVKAPDGLTVAKIVSKVKVSQVSVKTYTGKQIKPIVKLVSGKTTLKAGRDYTVKYGKNIIGKGTITITGKGKYNGKIVKTFSIVPKATTLKISSAKGKLNVVVGKRKEATKYQIQYGTNKSFKGAKKITTKSLKKSVKVSKGKTYYVRVRAIKTVDKKSYTGKWSTIKKVKIK